MPNYKLTNKAVEDLSKIWEYTFEVWTEKQADKYYNEIIVNCERISENPDIGKSKNREQIGYIGLVRVTLG